MRRRGAWIVVLAVVAAIALVTAAWWWRGPSPEAEAAMYFDRPRVPKRVVVWDCVPGAQSEPESDAYWCLLTSTERVMPRVPGAAHVGVGTGAYCFRIPRAAGPPWERSDRDAYPSSRVGSYRGCG
jgi:hypothetical protein